MLDLKYCVKDSSGKDVEQYMEETKQLEKMTLGKALCSVLLHAPVTKENDTLEFKLSRYNLFKKIKDLDEVELNQEEKNLLVELTNSQYDVFFTGQIVELIK